jgi:hypothetical protein
MSCCWPQGDPKLPGFSFCGQPVARPGLPYCVEHMRRAHPAAQRPVLHKSSRGPGPQRGAQKRRLVRQHSAHGLL